MKLLFLSFLLGLLSACGFEPLRLWPLTILAFAGLLWLLGTAPSLKSALARGYWFGFGQFVLGLNWIATAFTYQAAMPAWLGWIAVVALSFYLAVYPAAGAGLAWKYSASRHSQAEAGSVKQSARGEGLRLVLLFAAAWILTEWMRATMFTGFAWNPVGVALLPTPLSHAAALVGTYGLSAVLILVSGALLLLIRRDWLGGAGVALGAGATALLAALAAPATLPATNTPLRIVQPNIGQEYKWSEGFADDSLRLLGRLSQRPGQPGILLWPEAAVTDSLEDGRTDPVYQEDVARTRALVRDQMGRADLLLTGGITIRSATGRRASSATNSVFAIDRAGAMLGRYDKAHLVPYGEYLPMRPILSAIGLSRLAPGSLDFDAGPGPQTLTLPLIGKAGFQLCYEIIFSGEVVDRANRPAFLFNPSNDAWFGAWGPPQHLAQARLRALEEGLPVLRSTPTGISAVIDAEGELVASLPWRTAGVIDTTLPAPKPPTLFARFGNILPAAFGLVLLLVGLLQRRGKQARGAGI
jgi:apolipoprotein N-acyltransferase